jgi:hypothetical protein
MRGPWLLVGLLLATTASAAVRAPRSLAMPWALRSPYTGRIRPARLVAGTFDLGTVNPAGVSPFNNNCAFASIATDLNGKGVDAVAYPTLTPTHDAVLTGLYGPPRTFLSPLEVALTAWAEGPGYMGIVAAAVAGSPVGHAFNVQNVAGHVLFLDGQSGTVITDLRRYWNLRLFDTR